MISEPFLPGVVVEGAVDRFLGRPRGQNPYSEAIAREAFENWKFGWDEAEHLLDLRGQEEARRWLSA